MKHIRYLPLLAALGTLALLPSCSEQDDVGGVASDAGRIAFTVTDTPAADAVNAAKGSASSNGGAESTRASQTTAANLTEFGVSASKYEAGTSYQDAAIGSLFYNLRIDAATGSTGYYWPGVEYDVAFFAYAPYGNESLTVSGSDTKGRPSYTYTVPDDNFKQADFITAEVLNHSGAVTNDKVPLSFTHHLSDIHLKVKNIGYHDMKVHTITLRTLHDKGTYADGTGWTLPAKGDDDGYKQFTAVFADNTVPGQDSAYVTGDGGHFMMLPQTVAKDSDLLVVDVTFGGHRDTLIYKLPEDITFEGGKAYTLRIALGTEYIDVEAEAEDWDLETGYNFRHNITLTLEAEEWVKQDNYDNPGDIKHVDPSASDWDNQGTYDDPTTINTGGNGVDDWTPQGE